MAKKQLRNGWYMYRPEGESYQDLAYLIGYKNYYYLSVFNNGVSSTFLKSQISEYDLKRISIKKFINEFKKKNAREAKQSIDEYIAQP